MRLHKEAGFEQMRRIDEKMIIKDTGSLVMEEMEKERGLHQRMGGEEEEEVMGGGVRDWNAKG